ncbi:hypothetical protein ScPMuIL_014735 [Solemya velum]
MALSRVMRFGLRMTSFPLLLSCVLLVSQVCSVSRDNFKRCDQSGFCKRHRAVDPGHSPYISLFDTLDIQPSQISVELLNTKNNVRLRLELFGLQHQTTRIKINEVNPLKPRYEIPVGDVLNAEPQQDTLTVVEKNDDHITLSLEKSIIVLNREPFRIDFINDDEPTVSINAQGLLKFEHLRKKKEDSQEKKEENEEEKASCAEEEVQEEDEPDMWEETFKSFHDSKPNGPTSVGLDVSFPGFEHVYGIPEHAESMALKSTKSSDPYRLFNLDVFEYELYNPMALYGAVPVMLAHNEKRTVGIFWHNAAETWVDIASNVADKTFFSKMADLVKGSTELPQTDTHWFSESGIIDLFIMLGPEPSDVFSQYGQLTGTTPIPPLFGIAYHQCRWNYNDEDDIRNVDAKFDEYDLPMDLLWLDIEHTDGKRYFTWDGSKFSHPDEMVKNLTVKGRKLVTIVDPHLKKDDSYSVYSEAKSQNHLVKNKDGSEYEGWCWPGSSGWPDFLNPEVRKWWASKFAYSSYAGSSKDLHVWNDMNEPSVFNGPEVTFQKDVLHYGGWENRDVHNLYGFYVHKATMDGLLERTGGEERPFLLTRAFFAGSQKFGAVWTGDNMASWDHLKISNPMILSLNLVGITFSGADVGGFFHNPDAELVTRWYQAGAFQPFFRAHAHLDTKRREPHLLPNANMLAIRDALQQRYSYLPYWYTLFYWGERNGGPVMMPLWVEFPKDKSTFSMDDQFMIGKALLVKPITEQGSTGTNVYFPGNDLWYDVESFQTYNGGDTTYVRAGLTKIPVFQRGGTIIPRKMRNRRSSTLMKSDPFTLFICLNREGEATGNLFIDDYHSYNYKNGKYILKGFNFRKNVLESVTGHKDYQTDEWIEKIVISGFQVQPSIAILKGSVSGQKELEVNYDIVEDNIIIRKPGVNIAENFKLILQP